MPSVGSVGDSYDNALAETINGLYKAEVIHRRGPWRSLEAVEYATLEWVDWFNNRRLLEPIGHVPFDRSGSRVLRSPGGTCSARRLTQTKQPPRNPGQFTALLGHCNGAHADSYSNIVRRRQTTGGAPQLSLRSLQMAE